VQSKHKRFKIKLVMLVQV